MATYRQIYISFWSDTKVCDDFSPEDKYFYIYLLTNPHTNICGCYEISSSQMAQELGYNEESVKKLLRRMEQTHDVIRYNWQKKELLILNWHKYNWTKSPKMVSAVRAVAQYIKTDEYRVYILSTLERGGGHSFPGDPCTARSHHRPPEDGRRRNHEPHGSILRAEHRPDQTRCIRRYADVVAVKGRRA